MDSDGEEASENRISEFIDLYETRDKENSLISYTVAPTWIIYMLRRIMKKSRELAVNTICLYMYTF